MGCANTTIIDGRTLAATKFEAPPVPSDLVARTSLIERLSDYADKKAIMAIAPSGFGKTTLLSSWKSIIESQAGQPSVSWLTLDEIDNDPARFWNYLVAALEPFAPGFRSLTANALSSNADKGDDYFVDAIINGLAAAHRKANEASWVLIIDDYHVIDNPEIHASFKYFLRNAPRSLRIAISSRTIPPLSTESLIARGQILAIDHNDLRFDKDEAELLFSPSDQEKNSPGFRDEFERLYETVNGWPAGVRLASAALKAHENPIGILPDPSAFHSSPVAFLVDDLLAALPSPSRDFLVSTSFLRKMCAPLCDYVLERSDSETVIEALQRENLVLEPLARGNGWFAYRSPWAEALRKAFSRCDLSEQKRFHARASNWFERYNMPGDALAHACASKEWDRVAWLIEKNYMAFANQSRFKLLSKALQNLPRSHFSSSPRINLAQAFALIGSDSPQEALYYVHVAERLLSVNGSAYRDSDRDRLRAECLALKATCAGQSGKVVEGKSIIDKLPKEGIGDDRFLRSWVYTAAGASAARAKNPGEAISILRECVTVAKSAGNVTSYLINLYFLARHYIDIGALALAEEVGLKAASHRGAFDTKQNILTQLGNVIIGMIFYKRGDFDRAVEVLDESRRILSRSKGTEFYIDAAIALALVQRSRGEYTASQATLHEAIGSGGEKQAKRSVLVASAYLARIQLDAGQKASAYRWMIDCDVSADDEDGTLADLVVLARARVKHAYGKTDEALADLNSLIADSSETRKNGTLLSALVYRAMILGASGRKDSALASMRTALELASEERIIQPFLDEGSPIIPLLERFPKSSALPEQERELARTIADRVRNAQAPDPQWLSAKAVSPLTERESDVCKLLVAGYSNKEVARSLGISENTAHTHRSSIYAKLGVSNRKGLVEAAGKLLLT
ncbi:LuxR C-terminal-related transcriptional regulator [Raoultibacter massiliensis]|uniref:LuxR C-terminal-related transcriptional regulator n=1 Tax=Raoultibacter massiliensis TaxID=1852371 RepID=UPI000C854DE3|nr:LuxR C-terminal-related transcriptional regulator [Raoultibacter massiliensis]